MAEIWLKIPQFIDAFHVRAVADDQKMSVYYTTRRKKGRGLFEGPM